MQDRPTAPELLEAIEEFLRQRSADETDRYFKFQFLVASNSLAILRRQWEQEEGHLRSEWQGLDALLGVEPVPPTVGALREGIEQRISDLCDQVRAGDFDPAEREDLLVEHLLATTRDKLRITSPAQADDPA